jgi:RNA polymerase sigma-70 factor (subfamily 1)
MPVDTHQLVERIRAGDRDALEALLRNELPGLRAYVRLRAGAALRERESASDLAQSACREVLGKLEAFQYGGEAGFRDWLYATALRKIVNRAEHWGAQKRDVRRELPLHVQGGSPSAADDRGLADVYCTLGTPSQHAIARETLQAMEAAFDKLPEDRREIIVLARVVGLDHAGIAQRLGCSEATARQRLFRALAELAEWLEPEDTATAP